MYKHTKVYSLKVEVKKKESETGVAACQVKNNQRGLCPNNTKQEERK